MSGVDTSDSDDEDSEDESPKKKRRKEMATSGDDLGENFVLDEEDQKTGWVDEVLARREEDGSTESGSEAGSDSEDEQESEDEENGDELSGVIPGEEQDWEQSDDETIHVGELTEGLKDDEAKIDKGNIITTSKEPEEVLLKGSSEAVVHGKKSTKSPIDSALAVESKDLPYVIEAPQSLDEFRKVVDGRSDMELVLAIQRIRACNAISLAAENRKKMQVR